MFKKETVLDFLWLSSSFLTLLAKDDFMLVTLKDVWNADYPLSESRAMKLAQCRWQRTISFMRLYIPYPLSEMGTNFPVDWIKCSAQNFEATKYDRKLRSSESSTVEVFWTQQPRWVYQPKRKIPLKDFQNKILWSFKVWRTGEPEALSLKGKEFIVYYKYFPPYQALTNTAGQYKSSNRWKANGTGQS